MRELLDTNQMIQIADNNANLLPVIAIIIAATYIIYALISVSYNNKRLKKLQRIKRKIQIRHDSIVNENERRKRLERKNNI